MSIEVPNPDCEREDCKYQFKNEITTLACYTPIYDKTGNIINPNGNITYGLVRCFKCDRMWRHETQYGKSKYTEVL